MSVEFDIKLAGNLRKELKGKFGKYTFEVGILKDAVHRKAKSNLLKTQLAGGPVRAKGKPSNKSIAQVAQSLRAKTRINYLTRPFKVKKNEDILRFSKAFFKLCLGRGQKKQVENYLQAIIRNPITRGDYGRNSRLTAKIKGFNRLMIDTGQFFRAITARTKVKGGNVSK